MEKQIFSSRQFKCESMFKLHLLSRYYFFYYFDVLLVYILLKKMQYLIEHLHVNRLL